VLKSNGERRVRVCFRARDENKRYRLAPCVSMMLETIAVLAFVIAATGGINATVWILLTRSLLAI
jgi:hypothetical protein